MPQASGNTSFAGTEQSEVEPARIGVRGAGDALSSQVRASMRASRVRVGALGHHHVAALLENDHAAVGEGIDEGPGIAGRRHHVPFARG